MKKSITAACFLLGAASAGVIMPAPQPAPDDAAEHGMESGAGPAATQPPAPLETALDQARQWEAAILARPLFSPDRHPISPAPTASGESTGLPRLSGIMITPDGRRAIFAPAGGGKPAVVAEGSSLGGYVVRTISLGEVVLTGPDGSHRLHPTLDHAPPARQIAPPVAKDQDAAKTAMPSGTNQ